MDAQLEKALGIVEKLSEEEKINSDSYKTILDVLMLAHNTSDSKKKPEALSWSDPLLAPYVSTQVNHVQRAVAQHIHAAPAGTVLSRPNPKPYELSYGNSKIILFYHTSMGGMTVPRGIIDIAKQNSRNGGVLYHFRSYINEIFGWRKEDHIINPSTGLKVQLNGTIGRKILVDAGIDVQKVTDYLSNPDTIPYNATELPAAPVLPALHVVPKIRAKLKTTGYSLFIKEYKSLFAISLSSTSNTIQEEAMEQWSNLTAEEKKEWETKAAT